MLPANFRAVIVGGGPVGLVAAHALLRAGIDFVVLEKRETISPSSGASLLIWPHSLRIFQQLGFLKPVEARGAELTYNSIQDTDGRTLGSTAGASHVRKSHGTAPLLYHRPELVAMLYECLPQSAKDKILLEHKVANIQTSETGVIVKCTNGRQITGSIVIGAEGTHSITRQLINSALGAHPAASKWDTEGPFKASFRCMWCNLPPVKPPGVFIETHGPNTASVYLAEQDKDLVIVYEKIKEPQDTHSAYTEKDLEAFANRHANLPICDIAKLKDVFPRRLSAGVTDLDEGSVSRRTWSRLVIVGDACQKFSPNLGLGFNSGIQDVVSLCNELFKLSNTGNICPELPDLIESMQRYEKSRFESSRRELSIAMCVLRLSAWSNLFYKVMDRYLVRLSFVDWLLWMTISLIVVRDALVLNYVPFKEPNQGLIPWKHKPPSDSGAFKRK